MPALWNEKELCGLVFELQLPDPTGDKATPRYFFHLTFGQRVVPDEDGVELPNRWAARDEALAVVRDLAKPEVGGSSRRWASWFLEVADEEGSFFRIPIGHPALEVVTPQLFERGPVQLPGAIASARRRLL
jgi:hypothetical protein